VTGFVERARTVAGEIAAVLERVRPEEVAALIDALLAARSVTVVGVGREGLVARALTMRLMHAGIDAHWVWDDTTPAIGPADLLLAVSGSGEIGHVDHVARRAQEHGARLAVVTADRAGRTSSRADVVLAIPAVAFGSAADAVASVQPMGTLFEQVALVTFDLLVLELVDRQGIGLDDLARRHRNLE
jgi:6-phospho-3-hexuloisomerase